MKSKNILRLMAALCLSVFLSSCASAPVKQPVSPPAAVIYPPVAPGLRHDVYHVVSPGETLWRLSKMYDVKIADIMRANKLEAASKLVMGQRLLIPGAAPKKAVDVPLYNSSKWKYIIIHHSATDKGNALSLFRIHLRRGFLNGLGYHFLIDNGTSGKDDGQIEISPRWLKQEDGAHCRASGMNQKGIGICLVGNFSRERVSSGQMASLVYLVNTLRRYYNIPLKNIMGHGQVPGARTECPGKYFPWQEFLFKLEGNDGR